MQEDWSLECSHLYQHICYAHQLFTRYMPNVTSTGRPIRWQLPSALQQLLVDRLTARHVIDSVNHPRSEYPESEAEFCFCLPMQYFLFAYRYNRAEVVSWSPPSLRVARPSMLLESENVAEQEEWEGEDDEMEDGFHKSHAARTLAQVDNEDSAHHLPELLPLAGSFSDTSSGAAFFYGLWYGPALRRAIDEAAATSSTHPITVLLNKCPVARVVTDQRFDTIDSAELPLVPQLIARDFTHWLTLRGLSQYGEPASAEHKQRMQQWLDGEAEEEQSSATAVSSTPAAAAEATREDKAAGWAEMQDEFTRYVRRQMAASPSDDS